MKKFSFVLGAIGMAAAFIACSDDSSSSPTSSQNQGPSGAGKACLNTFDDDTYRCFTGSNVQFLCGGSSDGLKSSVLVEACPENPTATCPDYAGDGVTYFYTEGANCHSF